MVLLTRLQEDPIVLGARPFWQIGSKLGVLAAIAGFVAIQTMVPKATPYYSLYLTVIGVLFLIFAAVGTYRSTIAISKLENQITFSRSLLLWRAENVLSLTDCSLLMRVRETVNVYGEPDYICSTLLVGPESVGSILIFKGANIEQVDDFAINLRDASGLKLQRERKSIQAVSSFSQRWIARVFWTVFALAAIVIIRPLFSMKFRSTAPLVVSSATEAVGIYREGSRLLHEEKYLDAEKKFLEAIRLNPSGIAGADSYNDLAYALAEQHRLDEALNQAEKALSLAPGSGNIQDTVAEMHERKGEYLNAILFYKRALGGIPDADATETLTKFGRTFISLHRFKDAIPFLRKSAARSDPKWSALARKLLLENGENIDAYEPIGPINGPNPNSKFGQGRKTPIPNLN